MNRPWLSVVMPTYNGAAYLPAALESVLAQDTEGVEIIAVDDGSTDATLALLAGYASRLPLRVVARPRVGNWVANSNAGLALARGEYACFLHQDDAWLPNRLSALKQQVRRLPEAALILHPCRFIDAGGRWLGTWRCPLPAGAGGLGPDLVVERLLVQNFIAIPAPLFPRELALQIGGLDEGLWFTADWDLWLKLAAAGPTAYHPKPLAAFRIHPVSQTAVGRAGELFRQYQAVQERHLARWEARHPGHPEVGLVARLSTAVNHALASCAHSRLPDVPSLVRRFLELPLSGWHRFLRDSRIVERALARLRARWRQPAPGLA
jgi:hypothetical protein